MGAPKSGHFIFVGALGAPGSDQGRTRAATSFFYPPGPPLGAPDSSLGAPKTSQERPKISQEHPKNDPRAPQERPKSIPSGFGCIFVAIVSEGNKSLFFICFTMVS